MSMLSMFFLNERLLKHFETKIAVREMARLTVNLCLYCIYRIRILSSAFAECLADRT